MNSQGGIQRSSWKQWVAASAAASIMFQTPNDIVWVYDRREDLLGAGSTIEKIGLIVLGAILGGISAEIIGRKRTLLAALIFLIPGCISSFAFDAKWLWIFRMIDEFRSGIICAVVPLYISEIASINDRGNLMVMQLLVSTIGTAEFVAVWSLHDNFYVGFKLVIINSWLVLAITVLFHAITIAIFPETPHYLNSKKEYQKAAESFAYFRGIREVKIREDAIEPSGNTHAINNRGKWLGKLREMREIENCKNLAIIFSLILIRWLGGQYGSNLTLTSWAYAYDNNESGVATVIIYGLKLIFAVFTLLAIGVLKRKISLLVVIFLSFIAAIICFPTFQLNPWIVVIALLVQYFGHMICVGVTLAYTGEFFPTNVRALATVLIISFEVLIRNLVITTSKSISDKTSNEAAYSYVGSGIFFVAFFAVWICFPKSNKLPNFELPIENSAGRKLSS